jgi:PAS domain S-box-containing protein
MGASVARLNLERVDSVLKAWPGHALLLSPQQITFASDREDWVEQMAVTPTSEQLKAIRELKQFGNTFEKGVPQTLAFDLKKEVVSIDHQRYAVVQAPVQWNDPQGEWTLVLLGNLDEVMPLSLRITIGMVSGTLTLLLGGLFLIWRRRLQDANHERLNAEVELKAYTHKLELDAQTKADLAQSAAELHQASTLEQFAKRLMSDIGLHIRVEYGVLYVFDDATELLTPAGGYGVLTTHLQTVTMNEGLVGQCAKSQTKIVFTDTAVTDIRVTYGGGEFLPKQIILSPVVHADKLCGVLVVASVNEISAQQIEALDAFVDMAASNLEILLRNLGTQQQAELLLQQQMKIKESEAKQKEQIALLQAIVDAIPYPVFYKNTEARFIGINYAYEQTFGVNREQLIGKRVLDLDYLSEADRVAYQQEDEALIFSVGKLEKEVQVPFADGRIHDTLYYICGFSNDEGKPGGLVGTFIDVSDRKKVEDLERFNRLALGRESRIVELKREVNDLARALGRGVIYASPAQQEVILVEDEKVENAKSDIASIQSIQADFLTLLKSEDVQTLFQEFSSAMSLPMAIIDPQATVLVASNWQRACTDFHRVNKQSCANCIESDTDLASKLEEGAGFTMYRCKNGMTDCAAPIIVDGVHVANAFIGQFHLEKPDVIFFRKQAEKFGMDAEAYVTAVQEAPIMDEKKLPHILGFLARFARLIGSFAVEQRRARYSEQQSIAQSEELRRERIAAMSLAEDAEKARTELAGATKN